MSEVVQTTDRDALERQIVALGPWFHQIEVAPGVRTRDIAPSPGPQPVNHPMSRWEVFKDVIPADLTGARVLDIGSADGFFAIELAKRGAHVVAQDAFGKMVARLQWAAEAMGLSDRITGRVGTVDAVGPQERYDFVLFLGLLYHLKHPLLDLERLSKVSDTMYLESAIDPGDQPYLYLKPPQPGVHAVPKWFPTSSCIEEMLKYVGFTTIEKLPDPTPQRASYIARR